MSPDFLTILTVAATAALASPVGGVISLIVKPTTMMLSIAVGLAAGLLLGTFAFEMMPRALELVALPMVVAVFCIGFGLVYGLDLYVNRGELAGPEAEQFKHVERFHRRKKPRGDVVTVIGGATSAEELIEGLVIGVGAAIDTNVALIVGLAIFIDNVGEAMSMGELAREQSDEHVRRRVMVWTGTIGAALFASAMAGWFLLRGLPDEVLGSLLALGAGAMFYLTVSDLLPEAESHHFQQSAAIATAIGFLTIMVLSHLSG